MKKLLFLLLFGLTFSFATKAQDDKDKTKKTSTVGQKVHNAVSHHKHYKGTKSKHKDDAGKTKTETNDKKGKVEVKEK